MAKVAAAAAAVPDKARVARRVVRGLTDEYEHFYHPRKEVSYRGGWQNSTQKLQWFWFGFKKYGFLANLANMLRMREAWWESGEKRLIGMDGMGHKYWETDDSGRTYAWGYRFPDYPHHWQFSDQSKIPRQWIYWCRQIVGRSPPQMEALHKELGPDWRDYNEKLNTHWQAYDEADRHSNPQGVDGFNATAGAHVHPFNPQFKIAREYYGHSGVRKTNTRMRTGIMLETHLDEFNPEGGTLQKIAFKDGLEPDGYNQDRLQSADMGTDDDKAQGRMDNPTYSNFVMSYNEYDKSKRALDMWWEYRGEQGEKTKESRAQVSAFDHPHYASKNTTGTTFGFVNRYKEVDPYTTEGFRKSSLHYGNRRRHPLGPEGPEYITNGDDQKRWAYQNRNTKV